MTADTTPLVVDLDDTLIRTDALYETFWAALARDPVGALGAVLAARRGKAALKAALARVGALDPAALPYNADVLALIEARRADGGEVILATAADIAVAGPVAEHLGCFDAVLASDGARNLKGAAKAAALEARYGRGGFDYAGDAETDLPVWRAARRAITVGASPSLRRKAEAAAEQATHLARPGGARAVLSALRPHQWLKNLLIFLPAVAAHAATPGPWIGALIAFVTFSMAASGVYLLNDMLDLAADRAHPRKRHRALASGRMRLAEATVLAPALVLAALTLAALAAPPLYALALLAYAALTTAYSLWLKRKLVIDICVLAGLYTMRVIAGGLAAGVTLSPWLLALTIFLFLSLAAVKRQAELVSDAADGRVGTSGRAYLTTDLPVIVAMALASGYVAVLVLALYINSPDVAPLYAEPRWLWGVAPILLYWVSRAVMLAHRGRMHDDPVVFAIRDRVSHVCLLAIAGLTALGSWA